MAHPKGEYPTQEERTRATEIVARLNGEVRFDDERMTDDEAVIVFMCAFGVKRSVAADELSVMRGHGGDLVFNPRTKTIDGPTCRGFGVPGFIESLKKED